MLVSQISAKCIFKRGDKVIVSLEGLKARLFTSAKAAISGVVTGFSRNDKHLLYIRRKDHKKPQIFAWWFWERKK